MDTGNVGIGTTSPGGALQVVGSATTAPLIISTGTAASQEVARITSAGSLGIGTTSPASKLAVNSLGLIGSANNAAYDIGAGRFAAGSNYYSYGSFCAGESTGGCTGTGGIIFNSASIRPGTNDTNSVGTSALRFNKAWIGSGGVDATGTITTTGAVVWATARTETLDDAGAWGAGINSGFYQSSLPAPAADWYSGASGWQHLLSIRHTNTTNNYAMQFAGSFFDQDLYFRKTNNLATTAWDMIMRSRKWIGGAGTTGTAGTFGNTWRLGSNAVDGLTGANTWLYLYNGAGTGYHDLAAGNIWSNGSFQNGTLTWGQLTSFPAACPAGQYVSAVGATLTCSTPPSASHSNQTFVKDNSGGACGAAPAGEEAVQLTVTSTCAALICSPSTNMYYTCGGLVCGTVGAHTCALTSKGFTVP